MEKVKYVAFTFDDGPLEYAEDSTAMRLLRILEKYGQRSTFFYVGEQIEEKCRKEMEFARSIGCEAGNHTYSHSFLTKCTRDEVVEEFAKTQKLIEEYIGKTPTIGRLPYMDSNEMVLEAAGMPLMNCNVDSQDYLKIPSDTIIQRIMDAEANGELENSIVLMHEQFPDTIQAVEYLIPTLMEKGYRFVTVSELAEMKGVSLENGVEYRKIE